MITSVVPGGIGRTMFAVQLTDGPAAVGRLQFEVLQYRLKDEYKVGVDLQKLPYDCSAWVIGDLDTFKKPINALLTRDQHGRPLVLFSSTWEKDYAIRENPGHQIVDYAT